MSVTNITGINPKYSALLVRPQEMAEKVMRPPPKPPPTAPIMLLTFLFFAQSLEEHT